MRVEILYDRPISTAHHLTCAYPLTTCCEDGAIVCVYRRGREKHSYDGILLSQRSTDLGQTFADPVVLFDGQGRNPPLAAISGGLCQCGDGSLLAVFGAVEVTRPEKYVFSEEGFTQRHLFVTARSTDGGCSWEPWAQVDERALGKHLGPTSNPLLLAGGRLFIPGERHHQEGQVGLCASFSDDHGRTLEPVQDCLVDASAELSLCDARYAIFGDGQVLAMIWAFRQDDERTVEVRRSLSNDHGRTWSPPLPVGHLGQITTPLVLSGDAVLAASNYRWPPQGIRLWISRDRGVEWPVEDSVQMWDAGEKRMLARALPVAERRSGDGVWNALPDFTFGTPDLTSLPDGTVLLTYYAESDGPAQVRACRFEIQEVS
jgi:hypothetical protein